MLRNKTATINAIAVVLPFIGMAVVLPILWNNQVIDWLDVWLFLGFYLIGGVGISIGYHRLLSHRSFETRPAVRALFAFFGALAIQGPPIAWVADHRLHHSVADTEGDPHSPHLQDGAGWVAALRGFFHAHVGWLLHPVHRPNPVRYAPDLIREPSMRFLTRHYLAVAMIGLIAPALIGYAVGGTLVAAVTGLLWGGLVRVLVLHHVTWSVNSICHIFGERRFETRDRSRNFAPLAVLSMGEAWHNNHHAFPTSARHGLRWWEVDVSGMLIAGMARLGLIWNVVRISDERQRAKEVGALAPGRLASAPERFAPAEEQLVHSSSDTGGLDA
jgi:stearoyl-CoA desaturase (delta-9 desaturase)